MNTVVRRKCCSSFRVQVLEFELRLRLYEYELQFSPMFLLCSANPANTAKNYDYNKKALVPKAKTIF